MVAVVVIVLWCIANGSSGSYSVMVYCYGSSVMVYCYGSCGRYSDMVYSYGSSGSHSVMVYCYGSCGSVASPGRTA